VRTDANAAKRQEGISFLLIDMKTPGITVRPLILMDGGHEVNEIFFDDVKVPAENLVFEENKGWTVAKYLLGHERMGSGNVGASKRELVGLACAGGQGDEERQAAAGRPALSRPALAHRDRARTRWRSPRCASSTRCAAAASRRAPTCRHAEDPRHRGAAVITELMMQAVGPMAQPFKAVDAARSTTSPSRLSPRYFNYRKASIYAGSNEIQRNIIAKERSASEGHDHELRLQRRTAAAGRFPGQVPGQPLRLRHSARPSSTRPRASATRCGAPLPRWA
jgi:alkylation response protein AidB-like acyl-CoA dehydrogenase